mgnify:CR=1 FL=1
MTRAEAYATVVLQAIAARLRTVALDDPALTSLTFTVHLRPGGGRPRAVVMRAEVQDDLQDGGRLTVEYVDACGPTGHRKP